MKIAMGPIERGGGGGIALLNGLYDRNINKS